MDWKDIFEGMKVKRIKNVKNGNIKGIVIAVFSVSGTFHVLYRNGRVGRFCNPDNFEIIRNKEIKGGRGYV